MNGHRFDNRQDLDKAICDFLDHDGPFEGVAEGLDVSLSRMGAVDLDLLVDCLNEMKHRMAAAVLRDMKAESSLPQSGAAEPIRVVA